MKVDDLLFSKYVANALPQAKMVEVEQQLMRDGEAEAAVVASIVNFEQNADQAEVLLGVDEYEEQKNENIFLEKDRKAVKTSSEMVYNESETQNNLGMNINFSKDEALKVQELVAQFNEKYNQELTLDENLAQFYLDQRPGTFPEDAHEVVKGLHAGINEFNSKLQKALAENGLDYAEELKKLTDGMPLAEKYELYLNFLAAVSTLSMENMSEEKLEMLEDYKVIREHLKPNGEVTEEMLADVEKRIAEVLENNTLCLGSVNALRQIIAQLPEGAEAVEGAVTGSEADVRQKLLSAMATYVMYENGEIESLKNDEKYTPEMIAVGAAVGIEQANVINDVRAGRTTTDKAIRVLKIIGGVALYCLLMYAAIKIVASISLLSIGWMSFTLGFSTLANLVSVAFGLAVGWQLAKLLGGSIERIMQGTSQIFDSIVGTWRKTLWPAISKTCLSVWNWLREQVSNKTVTSTQSQQTEGDVRLSPAMA